MGKIEKTDRILSYDKVYMSIAYIISQLSYAEKAKVGCVIVSQEGQLISHGWNGMPAGGDNCCEFINENGELKTKPEVLHAEANAIMKCARYMSSTQNATLYVTLSPCINCAKMILQAGIKRVVFLNNYKDLTGIEILKKYGIEVDQLEMQF